MTDRPITLTLDPAEVQVLRTALGLLEDTLGREEADQLEAVQALIRRLEEAER